MSQHAHLIDAYENGGNKILRILEGLTKEDLIAFPVPGKWSIQQVIIHLADSEQVLAERMKRVIAEKSATLLAFDENRWLAHLHYNEQSVHDAAKIIELTRKQMARVLRALPDDAWQRQGVHNEAGPMTLKQLVEKTTAHLEHHLQFIVDKREKLGKMMW